MPKSYSILMLSWQIPEDSPDARYESLFKLYRKQEFLRVITGAEENITTFTGDPSVPKFEMLKSKRDRKIAGL